ncbi:MAG: type II toxin-antitoxin system VapC family toxin [Vicinamibacterales bacterium]
MSVAVADAHALIWYAVGPARKLGRRAQTMFADADKGRASIYVPTIALLEISESARRGRVALAGGFGRWAERLFTNRQFMTIDLTLSIVLAAESLSGIPERADRLIAATALHLDCPLITQDPDIARVAAIRTIW